MAGEHGRRKRGGLGQFSRRVWLLRGEGRKAGGDGLCPLLRSGSRAAATSIRSTSPSQFYGAGQVFYIGSGEFWRLRAIDPAYFEVLYTKLIRHVSQGRMLRGSSRGALLVERDRYELGETVVLRARLSDAQHEPLTQDTVVAQVMRPDDTAEPVKLQADPQRPGMYFGQFAVHQEGTYQVVLPVPDSNEEPISKYFRSACPIWNEPIRSETSHCWPASPRKPAANTTPQLEDAVRGNGDEKSLAESIQSRAEVKLLKGAPDTEFAQLQMRGCWA